MKYLWVSWKHSMSLLFVNALRWYYLVFNGNYPTSTAKHRLLSVYNYSLMSRCDYPCNIYYISDINIICLHSNSNVDIPVPFPDWWRPDCLSSRWSGDAICHQNQASPSLVPRVSFNDANCILCYFIPAVHISSFRYRDLLDVWQLWHER